MDSLAALAGIVSFALIYPWIVIWIKRYHDGGKSGWMSLLPIHSVFDGYYNSHDDYAW